MNITIKNGVIQRANSYVIGVLDIDDHGTLRFDPNSNFAVYCEHDDGAGTGLSLNELLQLVDLIHSESLRLKYNH